MPLGKIQTTIVNSLRDAGRTDAEKCQAISDTPDELTGSQLDKLLVEDHGVTPFQLQVAKGKAFKLAPGRGYEN
jgi:type IV pilus assembly protein PilB